MNFKQPQNDHRYLWTMHSKQKLFQYAMGPNVVKRIIRHPDRRQEGIAENTIAVMRRKDLKSSKREAWVMYQNVGSKKKIISAWIYPGESPQGQQIYVPDEVWEELEKQNFKNENGTGQEGRP